MQNKFILEREHTPIYSCINSSLSTLCSVSIPPLVAALCLHRAWHYMTLQQKLPLLSLWAPCYNWATATPALHLRYSTVIQTILVNCITSVQEDFMRLTNICNYQYFSFHGVLSWTIYASFTKLYLINFECNFLFLASNKSFVMILKAYKIFKWAFWGVLKS